MADHQRAGESCCETPWSLSFRADRAAARIADRHYNRQSPGSPQFVPPGACLVLRAEQSVWVTSWPLAEYVKHAWAGAWINSLFRREGGDVQASDMIRFAVAHTRATWPAVPELGMVTFVDPDEVESTNPGYCYLKAGFKRVGKTKDRKLIALQLVPEDMPEPLAIPGAQMLLEVC
ncbi:MAG TPA: hypothetical protein VF728_11000 [Nocardioides sp.]